MANCSTAMEQHSPTEIRPCSENFQSLHPCCYLLDAKNTTPCQVIGPRSSMSAGVVRSSISDSHCRRTRCHESHVCSSLARINKKVQSERLAYPWSITALRLVLGQGAESRRACKERLECMVNDESRACRSLDMCCCGRCAADDVSHMLGARASEGSSDACPFFLGSSETTLLVSLKQCSSISTLAETLVTSAASPD